MASCRNMLITGLIYASIAGCNDGTGPGANDLAIVIAHRGASYFAPEHTTAAYDRAIEDGADYIEQDVARTKDGILVVIHDSSLDRTARGPAEACAGEVRDRTYTQLLRCDFGSWFNEVYPERARESFRGLKILTLEEVLSRYRDKVGLYLEIKNPVLYPGIESQVASTIRAHGFFVGDDSRPNLFVSSFDPGSLKLLHEIDPGLPLVQLLGGGAIADFDRFFSEISHYADGIGLPSDANVDWSRLTNQDCTDVHVYAAETRMTEMINLRADGLFVDRPDLLRSIIDNRNVRLNPRPDLC